jgi:hypothetical protein
LGAEATEVAILAPAGPASGAFANVVPCVWKRSATPSINATTHRPNPTAPDPSPARWLSLHQRAAIVTLGYLVVKQSIVLYKPRRKVDFRPPRPRFPSACLVLQHSTAFEIQERGWPVKDGWRVGALQRRCRLKTEDAAALAVDLLRAEAYPVFSMRRPQTSMRCSSGTVFLERKYSSTASRCPRQ